jgi:TPR repeat protein
MKRFLFIFVLFVALLNATQSNSANFQKGLDAFEKGDFETALAEWRLLAEEGDVDAQYYMGWMYSNGKGVPKDDKVAVKWYTLAAGQGDSYSQGILGWMYQRGAGVQQDFAEAAEWYRKSAERGVDFAQASLGDLHAEGKGVTQDHMEAAKWYLKSAEQGNGYAQTQLVRIFREGLGVDQDYTEAAKWFRKSAEQEYNRSASELVVEGNGDKDASDEIQTTFTEEEYALLEELLFRYDNKNFDGTREIAIQLLDKGPDYLTVAILRLLVETYQPEYAELINQELGHKADDGDQAASELLRWHIRLRIDAEPDAKSKLSSQLFKLLRASYAAGNLMAAGELAWEYHTGELISRDDGEALRLARKIISDDPQDNAVDDAERIVCAITAEKDGQYFDLLEAREYCKRAADKGDEWSQTTLASTYLGRSVETKTGMDLLRQYSAQGNTVAMANLGWLLYSGEYGEFSSEDAFSLTQRAADAGVGAAVNNLGLMYDEGLITPKDEGLAYQYYAQAAEMGLDYGYSNVADRIFFRASEGLLVEFQENADAAIMIAQQIDGLEENALTELLQDIVRTIGRLPRDHSEAVMLVKAKVIEGSAEAALLVGWDADLTEPDSRFEALKWLEISARLAKQDYAKDRAVRDAIRRSRNLSTKDKKLVVDAAISWLISQGFNQDGTLPPSMQGTLTFLSDDGIGVTAFHVVRGCSNVDVLGDGPVSTIGRVLQIDSDLDVAIVKIDQRDIQILSIRAEGKARQGEMVSSFGYPTSAKDGGMASGIISATSGFNGEDEEFQFSSPIQSGFSGGPVVDDDGQLLGITTKTLSTLQSGMINGIIPQNANLAVKIDKVLELGGLAQLDHSAPFWENWLGSPEVASALKAGTATVICNRSP